MNPPEQQSQQMYIDGIQSMYQIRDTKLRYIKYNLQTEDLYSSNISVKNILISYIILASWIIKAFTI